MAGGPSVNVSVAQHTRIVLGMLTTTVNTDVSPVYLVLLTTRLSSLVQNATTFGVS